MGKLSAGDWVEVRSKEEILRTLDEKGQLEGMPFMPEMFAFCGMKMQVHKRAHKTCDTVFPVRGRRVKNAVHLETRCDGSAHGGCQAGCLLFWKEEWLKPVSKAADLVTLEKPVATQHAANLVQICTESTVQIHTQDLSQQGSEPVYVCQATRLPYMTSALSWWEIDQYIEDYTSGNTGFWRMFCGMVYSAYYNLSNAGIGLGKPMKWFYNTFHRLWGGTLFPRNSGTIPVGQPTPSEVLNLQPGELVRIKSHEEILRTLTTDGKNRGMTWDAELVPYCGGTYQVLKRVTKIINEQTGRMQEMKNPCIILDSVVCTSRYSGCRMFCPREIYSWWREIWLERVDSNTSSLENTKVSGRTGAEAELQTAVSAAKNCK